MTSTSTPRKRESLHIDLANGSRPSSIDDLPPVAAIFLILFDVKAGYTIAWKRTIPGVELDESVEFKSLPSGLHHVEEDLIYFVHGDDYAGISAFKNSPSEEEADRNARMLAVGALVPLSLGRMGKSWKLAEALKDLAGNLIQDPTQTSSLDEFWVEHQLQEEGKEDDHATQVESPSVDKVKRRHTTAPSNGHVKTRNRAVSTASALAPPGQSLSPHHPALSLPAFLDTFGPLCFPIYKAALLRKRLLIVGHVPVELSCNFVYDVSILSGIPSSVVDLLPLEPLPTRLSPLFSVGIHDMDILAPSPETSPSNGWIACTTDDILADKKKLYDTLITLPPTYSAQAKQKVWPTIKPSSSAPVAPEIKATQRDLRRYRTLRRELRSFSSSSNPTTTKSPYPAKFSSNNITPTLSTENVPPTPYSADDNNDDDTSSTHSAALAEPQSWSALAYNSFMWWASAGENRTDMDEEEDGDAALLPSRQPGSESPGNARVSKSPGGRGGGGGMMDGEDTGRGGIEMSIIAYFHRFTAQILKTLADVVDAADADADEDLVVEAGEVDGHVPSADVDDHAAAPSVDADSGGGQNSAPAPSPGPTVEDHDDTDAAQAAIVVEAEDMQRMGLDVWSESDREFVRGLVGLYWGRRCVVRGGRFDVCGVRLC